MNRPGNDATTAHITLTVTEFHDVLTSTAPHDERGTAHKMRLLHKHSKVSHKRNAKLGRNVLEVKRGGATLCFRIEAANKKDVYYPLGIAFVRRKNRGADNDAKDILGRKNFSFGSMHLYGRSLYITDNFKDVGPGDRYKFSVIIQRERDGALGVIDPDVDHENQP